MNKRSHKKFIHEGDYVAEVDVELIESDQPWAPYLSLDEAYKLDDIREALQRGDIQTAAKSAKIYTLTRVAM